MKNLKIHLPKLTLILFLTPALLSPPAGGLAQDNDVTTAMIGAISGSDLPSGGQYADATALAIVGRAIGIFLSFFGVIFLGLMIYGGYKWMMASGRDEEVKKSQEIIRAAIIGLAIVIASYALSYFVTSSLQKAI